MLALFYEAGFGRRVGPCMISLSALSKASVRLTAKPEGTFEEESTGGGQCQGLLKGSRCLLKTQGAGYFLQPCDKYQTL